MGLLFKTESAFHCQLRVFSGSAIAEPKQSQKADPGFGLGLLSVRLGLVGTVTCSGVLKLIYLAEFECIIVKHRVIGMNQVS